MIALLYLEFYCGIGGWGFALEHACRSIKHAQSAVVMDDLNHQPKKPKLLTGDNISPKPFHLEPKLLAAYDHSDLCNSVFTHNHAVYHKSDQSTKQPFYKPHQTPIERITKEELESHSATILCMSPPCQPHTPQHSNQHKKVDDPGSKRFLHLCHLLSVMEEHTLPGKHSLIFNCLFA
jgi:site-specific DNA-cytosine methylase